MQPCEHHILPNFLQQSPKIDFLFGLSRLFVKKIRFTGTQRGPLWHACPYFMFIHVIIIVPFKLFGSFHFFGIYHS